MHRMRSLLLPPALAGVVLLAALAGAGPVRADTLQDASALIKQEKFSQANDLLDKFLAGKPKDAQGRFLKGIALAELKRLDAAAAVFQQLTVDYPELPEPYNNLAVIYAQQKQYDKARAALETAIRTHPAYATAHENLGDIYARLASQAYGKALTLDASNASAQSKLALIQDLVVGTPGTTPATKPAAIKPAPEVVAEAKPAAPKPEPAKPEPAKTTPAPSASAPVVAAKTPPTPVATPTTSAVSQAKPAAQPTASPTPKPAAAPADADSAAKAVNAWAAAWSRKDVGAYLAAYAADFAVPDKRSRAAWEAERRQRIDRPGTIEVSLDQLRIRIDGQTARADFRQTYRSGSFIRKTKKRLDLVMRDGRWQIQRESLGD